MYYQIIAGADIGGWAGIAHIKDHDELSLLPKQGWVKGWETKHFALKNGEYTDYLPANIGCRLCSEKMRDILESCKSGKDVLQWLDAEVESEAGEKRYYFVLHFPVSGDMLDKKKSKYVRNILTKQVVNPKACSGHEVFSYKECSSLSFIVSGKVKEELKKAGCRGLVFIRVSPIEKPCMPITFRRLYRIFNQKHVLADEKKMTHSEENSNWNRVEKLNLPADLVDFIFQGKRLSYNEKKCTIGSVEIVSINSLILGRIYVDPKKKGFKKGYYTVPVVDLVAECNGFDAWGILVWLPDKQIFGTWDRDHRRLRVFPNATWGDIVDEPIKYLNAIWNPQGVETMILEPDDKYFFTEEI